MKKEFVLYDYYLYVNSFYIKLANCKGIFDIFLSKKDQL